MFHPLLQDGMSTLDEELTRDICSRACLYQRQCLFAAGGVFSGHHALNQAANPRPFLNADPLPIAAIVAVAITSVRFPALQPSVGLVLGLVGDPQNQLVHTLRFLPLQVLHLPRRSSVSNTRNEPDSLLSASSRIPGRDSSI